MFEQKLIVTHNMILNLNSENKRIKKSLPRLYEVQGNIF